MLTASKKRFGPSSVSVILVFLLYFMDSRVVSRIIFQNVATANIVVYFVAGLFALTFGVLALTRRLKLLEGVLLLLFGFSCLRLGITGVPVTIIGQLFGGYIGVIVMLLWLRGEKSLSTLTHYFLVALSIHAFVIWEPIGIIREMALANTSYWGAYLESGSDVAKRSIGLWNAPGYLAAFSAVCCGIFSVKLVTDGRIRWAVALLLALLCGISTGNRSFIAILFFVPFLVGFRMVWARKNVATLLVVSVVGLLSVVWYYKDAGYLELIEARFDRSTLEVDASTRLTGEAGVLPALQVFGRHIFFGAYTFDEINNSEMIGDDVTSVRPHTSLVQILASRGIFFGALFIGLEITACLGYMRIRRRSEISISERHMYDAYFAGFVFGNFICFVEPLLEFFPVLICVAIGCQAFGRANARPNELRDREALFRRRGTTSGIAR